MYQSRFDKRVDLLTERKHEETRAKLLKKNLAFKPRPHKRVKSKCGKLEYVTRGRVIPDYVLGKLQYRFFYCSPSYYLRTRNRICKVFGCTLSSLYRMFKDYNARFPVVIPDYSSTMNMFKDLIPY